MTTLSRRHFVLSAATTSVVFGLNGPMAFLQPAAAQTSALPTFSRFKVGDIEVTQFYDGMWQKAHDPNFIKGVSVDETKKALIDGGLTDAHVPITFTITLIKNGDKTIMFDAGTGGQVSPMAGLMMKEGFAAAGVDPKSISTIVMTHFHGDHISGLMEKGTNAQVFPDAEILVPSAEYKYWADPTTLSSLPEGRQGLAKRVQATMATWKNIRQIEDGAEVAPSVRAVASYGHTPGHTSYLVTSGDHQFMVLGDVANVPALFVRNPGWQSAFDQDPDLAEANRRKMFERAVADKMVVAGYHFGMPGAGSISKDGAGYIFTPAGG